MDDYRFALSQEIRGFRSGEEYRRFLALIELGLDEARLVEVPVDPDYLPGTLGGGRWFRDVERGCVWRLIEPDFPFCGLWELVLGE